MILKSEDFELSQQRKKYVKLVKTSNYLSKEKNMSSYLILTYNGNQASRKQEQFLFLHITH